MNFSLKSPVVLVAVFVLATASVAFGFLQWRERQQPTVYRTITVNAIVAAVAVTAGVGIIDEQNLFSPFGQKPTLSR